MTTLAVPGVTISILRQQTTTRRGLPLLISGRVALLGLPVPASVRVVLEGPSFDPKVTNFDTLSAPTGDYNVNIIADADGVYTVQAMAYPPGPPISLPGLPNLLDILPALAESASPPLVVGTPLNGQVGIEGPGGIGRAALPPPTSIEIGGAPISISPVIPITIGDGGGGAPGGFFGFPGFFPPTGLPPDQPTPITIITVTEPVVIGAPAPAPGTGVVSAQIVGFVLEG